MSEKKQSEDAGLMLPEEKHIYKPSEFNDLLDFNDNPLGFPHVLWCRLLPAIAALVSASGLIDIRENKENIDAYVLQVTDYSSKNGMQVQYIREFITATMDTVYSIPVTEVKELGESGETQVDDAFEVLADFIADFVNENYEVESRDAVLYEALRLTNRINGAFCSRILSLANKLELNVDTLLKTLVEAGYSENAVFFPELPILPADLDDICDFEEDPIDSFFDGKGAKAHIAFSRVVPTLAAMGSRKAGFDLKNDTARINSYIHDLLYSQMFGVLDDNLKDFVLSSIDEIYSADSNRLNEIEKRLKLFFDNLSDEDDAVRLLELTFSLISTINPDCLNLIYNIVRCKVSKELFEYIVRDTFDCDDAFDLCIVDNEKINKYLEALGLKEGATKNEVTSAFKKLTLQIHPDTIAGLGLSDEFIKFAQDRFIEIKEAYDYLITNM